MNILSSLLVLIKYLVRSSTDVGAVRERQSYKTDKRYDLKVPQTMRNYNSSVLLIKELFQVLGKPHNPFNIVSQLLVCVSNCPLQDLLDFIGR